MELTLTQPAQTILPVLSTRRPLPLLPLVLFVEFAAGVLAAQLVVLLR